MEVRKMSFEEQKQWVKEEYHKMCMKLQEYYNQLSSGQISRELFENLEKILDHDFREKVFNETGLYACSFGY